MIIQLMARTDTGRDNGCRSAEVGVVAPIFMFFILLESSISIGYRANFYRAISISCVPKPLVIG